MGNKRKREDKEARIEKKIRKLEKKLQQRRRVSRDSEDSEDQILPSLSSSSSRRASPIDHGEVDLNMPVIDSPTHRPPSCQLIQTENSIEPGPSTNNEKDPKNSSNQDEEVELEDEILQILGEAPQPNLSLGKNIHKDIASRWQNILIKGLSREIKEGLLKKYLIPSNCNLLVAPILNPEAKVGVPDILAKRDSTLLQKQNQIGVAIAALSQVSELILKNETSKQALLQPLSDACRILCDSHNIETKTRRSIIMSSINTSLRETLATTDRDKYLFGEDLTEKLKVAKTVQKTGESLLKVNPVASASKTNNPRNAPKRNLNFRGPIQRKPPIRASEPSSARGRTAARYPRATAYSRHPPPSAKTTSPTRKNYRR